MAFHNRWLPALSVAVQAALEAGNYFRSRLDSDIQVKTKSSPSDLVTDVDPQCERMIRERIVLHFPEHQILGEETTAPGHEASARAVADAAEAPHLWIVDPLDGTTNFVQGMPLSTVSIAYAENGIVIVGVIYDPYREEVFYGCRDLGGYVTSADAVREWAEHPGQDLPGQKLSVSQETLIGRSVVATGFPTRGEAREQTTAAALKLAGIVKSMRALGTAALHLAYVASGRLDAFWEYDLNAWDLAAGMFLVEQAGGVAVDITGAAYHLKVRDIIVSGHPNVAEAIREGIARGVHARN